MHRFSTLLYEINAPGILGLFFLLKLLPGLDFEEHDAARHSELAHRHRH